MWKRSGTKPREIDHSLDYELAYLWGWFLELHNGRGAGFSTLNPITYTDIEAWSRLSGNELQAWEVKAIKAIDAVACKPKDDDK